MEFTYINFFSASYNNDNEESIQSDTCIAAPVA